eukprot:862029-Alexandrium_andersonii.AAC.1
MRAHCPSELQRASGPVLGRPAALGRVLGLLARSRSGPLRLARTAQPRRRLDRLRHELDKLLEDLL